MKPARSVFAGLLFLVLAVVMNHCTGSEKMLIAHRGASAYAPEHTLESYRLAIAQGAHYVEQDLQITSDGVLVCLHDLSLERTTNVEEVFPDRFRMVEKRDGPKKQWLVNDFTLAEIKSLDAGSWFGDQFAGAEVLTWKEAIAEIQGQAGLFPELKDPEFYADRGFNMEQLMVETLRSFGLDRPGADTRTPVIIQSFSSESLERLRSEFELGLPLVYLVGDSEDLDSENLARVATFASGIGPSKDLILKHPSVVDKVHGLGMTVTPYTFRSSKVGEGFKDVGSEMTHFLSVLNVDGLFTDNPDLFPIT